MELYSVYHREMPDFLTELAGTGAMLRLKGVGMNCGCEYTSFPVFCTSGPSSRYEHSMGVGLIVWHFTHDRAQASAGLLHDISTPVFAHVVDFLNGDHIRQESTEARTEEMIKSSPQLQAALWKHGLTTDDVADYHRYPIADNDAPRLSADRLEYTLNNFLAYGFCTEAEVRGFYGDLAAEGEELCFRTPELAADFARNALRNARVYVCDEDRCSMEFLAGVLRRGLETGVISRDDLYTTEEQVIGKLEGTEETAKLWRRFRGFSRVLRSDTPKDGWLKVVAKKRYIDPYILGAGRVSEVFPEIGGEIRALLDSGFDRWLKAE